MDSRARRVAKRPPDRTTAYAKLVCSGARLAGEAERLACARHLADMADKGSEWTFDVAEAERHLALAELLVIGEGLDAKPLRLRGFQAFILGSLFGWRRKRSKQRRFREAFVQMGRQNGKSFLCGVLANDFALSGYRFGRIYCCATKQAQANIVLDEVLKFIDTDPELTALYKVRRYEHSATNLTTGTVIKAIGRDTKSADGFRSILAVVDEYHAHPTNQMYKLMLDGQLAVDNALTIAITTAGFNLNGPCYEHYRFCRQVLQGNIRKDSLFVYIAELDEGDDVWDRANWAKANPLQLWADDEHLDPGMLARMAEKAVDAKQKQGAELTNFLTKSLNRWVTFTAGAFIDAACWRACGVDQTLRDHRGRECFLGVDLSSGGDLTSVALVFPPGQPDEPAYVWSHSFIPELRLAEHERTDDVPYRLWVATGLVTVTSGMYGVKTDYKTVVAKLRQVISEHDLRVVGCGYDRHNADTFLADLEDVVSCDLTEVVQSAKSLNDATVDLQLSVKAGTVAYDRRNALLTWSAVNAVLSQPNSFGEVKVDKMTGHQRIDPIDALIDAWKLFLASRRGNSVDGEANLELYLQELGL